MSFDPNMRAVSVNAKLEALLEKQNAILEKIHDKLDEMVGRLAEDNDTIIDQNSDLKAKMADAVLILEHVRDAVQQG